MEPQDTCNTKENGNLPKIEAPGESGAPETAARADQNQHRPFQGFDLVRIEDETGISGTGRVAQGVVFADGTVALRWLTEHKSTAFYASVTDVMRIHGHNGKTRIAFHIHPFDRGRSDAIQDRCENCPFSSVGGLDARADLQRPSYVAETDWPAYRAGYELRSCEEYGPDWRTCSFEWSPALTICHGGTCHRDP